MNECDLELNQLSVHAGIIARAGQTRRFYFIFHKQVLLQATAKMFGSSHVRASCNVSPFAVWTPPHTEGGDGGGAWPQRSPARLTPEETVRERWTKTHSAGLDAAISQLLMHN